MYSLSEIAQITGARLIGPDGRVEHYLHDSRSLQSPDGLLFIALKTTRNNGHQYIANLVKKGVRAFLIKKGEYKPGDADQAVSFLVSEEPLLALQVLAMWHRNRFNIPVIGITGSNGKTVVKEWLYQLLKDRYSICRSPKSYNSQVGVPLSILNLNEHHTLGIFEAGISLPGEMARLEAIIRPTMGVLTSLGSAHDEGFDDRAQKFAEKIKLFENTDTVIVNGMARKKLPSVIRDKGVVVSGEPEAEVRVILEKDTLQVKYEQQLYYVGVSLTDAASVCNISTCIGVLLKLGLNFNDTAPKIKDLHPVALRLEIKNAINQSLVINDYYNSDLDSLKIALNYLQQQSRRSKKVVVVSDIEQSGIAAQELYRQLALLMTLNKVDLVIGIGKEISSHDTFFEPGSVFFESTDAFIAGFPQLSERLRDAGILLKGARSFGFEQISRLLQLKSHNTVFEVNLNHLIDNVNYYRGLLQEPVKIMGMVKAMGYGSGSVEIARTLEHLGLGYLAVAYADEGVELRQAGITLPILVMSPEEEAYEDMINYRLEPEIYSFKVLHAFANKLDTMGVTQPWPVHLKIDTGMHRLGFVEQELEQLVTDLAGLPLVHVQSVFSHLAASDNREMDEFTREQIRIFEKASALIETGVGYKFIRHICNSGGITRFRDAHYNMVRLGIGMYGIGVDGPEDGKLKNVGTLKSRISQVKRVKAGDTIGYNRNGKVEKDITIGIVPIGYADGFGRQLGNGRHGMYVGGTFCKTVGNICMDMCMIDISKVPCQEGDEVIIFENKQQINALAGALNTIAYEVLTNVSGRVKRVYVQE